MARPSYPDTLKFAFELDIEIDSALSFSAGELSNLIVNGLFELDAEGLLFPGVQSPASGHRLIEVGANVVSYHRRGHAESIDNTYQRLRAAPSGRPTKSSRELAGRLSHAAIGIQESILHQRMLVAKLMGLADKSRHPAALTDADRTIAETLLTAVEAIETAVESSVKPVL